MVSRYIAPVMLTHSQAARLRKAPLLDMPNKIALAMKLAGVTQLQIAAATGIPQGYISKIRNGRYSSRGLPTATASRLATFFGVQIEDLFPSREAVAS